MMLGKNVMISGMKNPSNVFFTIVFNPFNENPTPSANRFLKFSNPTNTYAPLPSVTVYF